jgi:hypothetical protein
MKFGKFEIYHQKFIFVIPTVRSKIKKIERAVINTLQLATRKNLIQMSLDVITIVTVIINY